MPESDPQILVRAPNWLGDAVMSLGFLRKLKPAFPGARVAVLARQGLEELFRGEADEVFGLPRGRPGVAPEWRRPWDLHFVLPPSFSSAWLAWRSGARRRIGYAGQGRAWLLTGALKPRPALHRAEEYAWLLRPFLEDPLQDLDLALKAGPAPVLEGRGDRALAVFHIHSEAQSRRMSVERWADLGRALFRRRGLMLALTGSAGERARAEVLRARLAESGPVANLAGRTGLKELAGLLAAADLVVSADSGPAHLANSLGAPTLVLFGAGDERKTGPYRREGLRVLRLEGLSCAPCVSNRCRFGQPRCLEDLSAAALLSAALHLLDEKRKALG